MNSNNGGNCWWWAANVFMALISYAEDNKNSTDPTVEGYVDQIQADLGSTYRALCGGTPGVCPTSKDPTDTQPPFTVITNANIYFDDIGWWTQAWINAYKWTGIATYLYLAEDLWNFVTVRGWVSNCGGVVQFIKADHTVGDPDAFANALYLWNSAWLYSITGESRYIGSPTGKAALGAASWIRGNLIYDYGTTTLGNMGARFQIADHVDGSCATRGSQSWLQSQGVMVNAWSDMYAAEKAYCNVNPSCPTAASYYNNLADELALTTIEDKQINHSDGSFTWKWEGQPGQAEPTVDSNDVLSEPCEPTGVTTFGSSNDPWPHGCGLGNDTNTDGSGFQPYLISKGMFMRGIYCSNHNFNDTALTTFITNNAANYLASLPHFGFLWDSTGPNDPVMVATQTSVLDGLDADLGGSYAMC